MAHRESFGVRQWVNIMLRLITFYLEHKEEIDSYVTPAIKEALELFVTNQDAIAAVNPPGPGQPVSMVL